MHSIIDYFRGLCLDPVDSNGKQHFPHPQSQLEGANHSQKAFGESSSKITQTDKTNRMTRQAANARRLSTIIEEQPKRMPKTISASILICSSSLLLLLLLFATETKCQTDSDSRESAAASAVLNMEDSVDLAERRSDATRDGSSTDEHQSALSTVNEESMITKQPRQQFRIHLGPTSRTKTTQHRPTTSSGIRFRDLHRRNSAVSDSSGANQTSSNSVPDAGQLAKQSNQKKISSATLKKLLNQTLPKYLSSNGTNLSPNKSSNFKFVFIQRATAAPPNINSTTTATDSKSSNEERASTFKLPNQLQTLAASVSKQLASSLLYSSQANGLLDQRSTAGNSDSGSTQTTKSLIAPSISILATQLATRKPNPMAPKKTSKPSSSESMESPNIDADKGHQYEIKRLHADNSTTAASHKSKQSGSKTARPSKIYNLPVKFVSNGQPNHIVFHTLKEHFATIRRLQSSASKTAGKKRKDNHLHRQIKLKGLNSRLIYLPLKYLSNARPHLILGPKAVHKSKAMSLVRSSDDS